MTAQTQMLHPTKSLKRRHQSESPPDNTQSDPTFTPYGITPPRNAEPHSQAPKDAQRRATAASDIPQAGVCSVTREVWPSPGGAVQYVHIIAAAKSGHLDYVHALERGFGVRKSSFNVHSSRNIQPLTMDVHHALDNDQIVSMPDDDNDVNKLIRYFVETPQGVRWKKNVFQVFPSTNRYTYRLIWLPGPHQLESTFIMHRKHIKLVDGVYRETGKETPFNAPFYDYPLIISHVPPHLMALNVGEKLVNLSLLEMHRFKKTYDKRTIRICARLQEFYEHITHGVPNVRQKGDNRSPMKRFKTIHTPIQPTSKNESRRITRSQHNNADALHDSHPKTLGPGNGHTDSNLAPSIVGPLFGVTSHPSCFARYGSRDLSVEGLNLDNFTGHPFDYPVKAFQIIHGLLELEKFKPEEDTLVPVGTSPSTPAPARLSRIPRLSPLSSPGYESYYTPSRVPVQPVPGVRNTTDQKANMSKPTKKATIPRPTGQGSSPTLLLTGPISRQFQPATVAAVSIAPSLGQETASGSPSHISTPPSRLPSPPSRFRRPSRAPGGPSHIPLPSRKATQTNVKDAPSRHGCR